jgi:predicted acyl esterase
MTHRGWRLARLALGITGMALAASPWVGAAPVAAAPEWWTKARSLYCPAACSGAGSALMKFDGPELKDRITSFRDLPKLLDEAQSLGSNIIYLVDYWEGGYSNKGDYVPRADLGGPAAFAAGVKAVHARGGHVILYLEAFIVSRKSEIGRTNGAKWAIMNQDGAYPSYPGTGADAYYLMWPGKGSGWSDYLAGVAERLIRDYDVDGFHLDSYGCQTGWKDYQPDHPDGRDPAGFDVGAITLVREFRQRVRAAKPDAVVMLECSAQEGLLAVTDGAQDESLPVLARKPWARDHSHKIFTSEFSLTQMEHTIAAGYDVSLCPWWLQTMPTAKTFENLRDTTIDLARDRGKAERRMRELWWCYDVLWANGVTLPPDIDIHRLGREIMPYTIDRLTWTTERRQTAWHAAVEAVVSRLEKMDLARARTPAQYLRTIIEKAENDPMPPDLRFLDAEPNAAVENPDGKALGPGTYRIMMPMRDGVHLRTDVYLPGQAGQDTGPWPIILIRSPYNPGDEIPWQLQPLFEHGYGIAIQSIRGRFGSEGSSPVFQADAWGEHQDGYDCVEWIARQPWCNGKVGTWGLSGPGITQYMMAGSGPPHLTCQHVGLAACDLYGQAMFQGGEFRKSLVENWLTQNGFDLLMHRDLMINERNYGPFWEKLNLLTVPERVNAPILHWGGWFDCFGQGNIDAFVAVQEHGGPNARGKQRIIIGPWPHGIARVFGEVELPQDVLLPPHIDPIEWFDYWMKGVQNDAATADPVYYYTIGDLFDPTAPGSRWRSAKAWPVPAQETEFHFQPDGGLSREVPPADAEPLSFDYDPAAPVRTVGGANLFLDKGPMDQREVEQRADVVTFTSEPLTEPMEVTGRMRVKLWASSSATDTDFTAKLCDVYPDGRSMLLNDGIIRARYRKSLSEPALLTPGEVAEFDIDLWSVSIIFNKGHRLRVSISSSNYPRFEVNPNNGDLFPHQHPFVVAHQKIYCDREHPSYIVLPVVK